MPKRFLFFIIVTALIWAGCGGSKSTTPAGVAITISPTTASVAGATTQQFTATVTGSTNTAVTWQVGGVVGGDATDGTISTTGLYTAPPVLPTTTNVAVTAIAQADTTKTAVAIVTLTAPAVTVSISPPSATVVAGTTQQFTPTVTVTGSTNNAVNWSVSGVQGGDAIHGTIDTTGLYTAPASPPKSAITVTATSQANTSFSASAPVTLQFGNASLKGTYVFLVNQGDNSSGSGFAYRGGTLQVDGAGHITAGVSDTNSSTSAPTNGSLTGTYSVGADGRGKMTFNDASGAHTFSFALTSSTRGQVIVFDSSAVTSGFIHLQDQTAMASVSGPFVFGMSGDSGGPAAAVGQLTFTGATVTGVEDVNTAGGGLVSGTGVVGSFTVPAGGRGTATLNSAQFVYYIIDASTLVLMNMDTSGLRIAGTAFAQSTAPFSNASLGSSAFFANGSAVSGNKPYALAARFDTNAATGQFSGGVSDVNSGGAGTSPPLSATYTVASNGRVQVTGSSNFIIWLASQKQGVVLQTDSGVVASGQLFQQQAGFQSVTGGYALATAGANSAGTVRQAIDGQVTISGFGSLLGTEDINNGSAQVSQSLTGNLTISTNGRATGSIASGSSVSYDFYFVSPDRFIMLSADSTTVLSGMAERQCSDCQF